MSTEYHSNTPSYRKLLLNDTSNNDNDLNDDYTNLSRNNSLINTKHTINNTDQFELNEANRGKVVRRIRTNSFNANNDLSLNPNLNTNNVLKTSLKKLFNNVGKQKLSPSSSINLRSNSIKSKNNNDLASFRNRKKRSNSHTYTTNTNGDGEEDQDDYHDNEILSLDEEDNDDELFTKKPLLSIKEKQNDLKMDRLNQKNKIYNPEIISSSTSTGSSKDSTKTFIPSSDSVSSSSSSTTTSNSPHSTPSQTNINENFKYKLNIDENNNNSADLNNLNSLMLDNKTNANKNMTIGVTRADSIRMRHNSNLNTNIPSVLSENSNENLCEQNHLKSFDLNEKDKHRNLNNKSQNRNSLVIIVVLCVVNLLNYIDRFTLAGNFKLIGLGVLGDHF